MTFGVLETQFDYTLACKHVFVEDMLAFESNASSIFCMLLHSSESQTKKP